LKPAASRDSFIRSAAQATSSAHRRIPIRWRLAGGSALLTFVILCLFAAIVGVLTTRQIRANFDHEVSAAADRVQRQVYLEADFPSGRLRYPRNLEDLTSAEDAKIRVFNLDGEPVLATRGAPHMGAPRPDQAVDRAGYRVESRYIRVFTQGSEPGNLTLGGRAVIQYARPMSEIRHTLRRVALLLLLGVLGGSGLALFAGLAVARRAIAPVAELTAAAREVERTRDPSRRLPTVQADDEVAELARTLEGMLAALDSARGETEATLARQRAFVADASHELRTPLTSVLANLELLAEELEGEQLQTAGAALRSTQRMRRLVGDLLLLARADARREAPRRRVELGDLLVEAAAELEPMAREHELVLDVRPVAVEAARDELHRLAGNLVENALHYTPPGTRIEAGVRAEEGDALLWVEDEGPGIVPELAERVFDRFVRGAGESGGGSGLGLAIVRAVAEAHGGRVRLTAGAGGRGARFEVRLPRAEASPGGAGELSTREHARSAFSSISRPPERGAADQSGTSG